MPVLFPGVAESLNIRVLAAGYVNVDSWWTETDRIREFWRLYLCDDDGACLHMGSERYPLPKDRIVIVPAGIDFEAEIQQPVKQLYFHFEFVGWPAKAACEVVPAPVTLEPDELRDSLADQLRKAICESKELEPILASKLKALAHLAIAEVLANVTEDRARSFLRIAEGQQELLAVLHYIDKHLDQPLNNSRLAEIALASESRFIRRFREATGRTPGRYVQDRRLRRAAELLVSTDYSIDQIAESCGFANRYYFTRVFAQRMGCPPARYRSDQPYMRKQSA
jgi:AraC-like DNA-binding protein